MERIRRKRSRNIEGQIKREAEIVWELESHSKAHCCRWKTSGKHVDTRRVRVMEKEQMD